MANRIHRSILNLTGKIKSNIRDFPDDLLSNSVQRSPYTLRNSTRSIIKTNSTKAINAFSNLSLPFVKQVNKYLHKDR
tara:strand:- start:334 stop:567 length:234 start_codon:yes stop_codon:yes gene_type:complete